MNVRVVRGFLNAGSFVDEGETINVDELRARELERNGLVERVEGSAKKEPEHSNKRAKDPKNKS